MSIAGYKILFAMLAEPRLLELPIRELARDMLDVMYDEPGIGLAAPQVGETIADLGGFIEQKRQQSSLQNDLMTIFGQSPQQPVEEVPP